MAHIINSLKPWMAGTDVFDRVRQPDLIKDGRSFAFASDKEGLNTFMVNTEGRLLAFGRNANGIIIGDNNRLNYVHYFSRPKTDEVIVDIQFGDDHAVLRTLQGKLYVLGDNSRGQLALGGDTSRVATPTLLCERMIIGADCGAHHTILLGKDHRVYTFGDNRFGQTGNGKSPHKVVRSFRVAIYSRDNAKQTNIIEKIVQVAAGSNHCLALSKYGKLWSWGWNRDAQLGLHDDVEFVDTPECIMLKPPEQRQPIIVKIVASLDNSAVLTADGDVYMWGAITFRRKTCRVPLLVPMAHRCFDLVLSQNLFIGVSTKSCECLVWGLVGANEQHMSSKVLLQPKVTNEHHPADVLRVFGDRRQSPFMLHDDSCYRARKHWQLPRFEDRPAVEDYERYRYQGYDECDRVKARLVKSCNNQTQSGTPLHFDDFRKPINVTFGDLRHLSMFFNSLCRNFKLFCENRLVNYTREVYEEYFHFLLHQRLKPEREYRDLPYLYRVTLELYDLANCYFQDKLKHLCLARLLLCIEKLPWSIFKTGHDLIHLSRIYKLVLFREHLLTEMNNRALYYPSSEARRMVDFFSIEFVDFASLLHHITIPK